MDVDRWDIPRGWYDLVVVGCGWEAIGAAWYALRLGARVAIVPAMETAGCQVKVPWPVCQWWTFDQPNAPNLSAMGNPSIGWRVPGSPFVEGLPRGGVGQPPLPTDKALGQLAAQGVAVFRGPACFQAPDVLEVQGHPIPFRKLLLALGQQEQKLSVAELPSGEFLTAEAMVLHAGLAEYFSHTPQAGLSSGAERSGYGERRSGGLSVDTNFHHSFLSRPIPPGAPRVAFFSPGPQECFWAQWLARHGCQVHLLLSTSELLPQQEPEIRQWVHRVLRQEGVRIHSEARCRHVESIGQAKIVLLERLGQQEKLVVDFLVAPLQVQFVPGDLQLECAGVRWDRSGVWIDRQCRTSNRRILAAGSTCGARFCCSRIAWAMVQWAVAKALGHRPAPRDWLLPFQCIPTDPPIFRLGHTLPEAEHQFWQIRTYHVEQLSCPGADSSQPEALRPEVPPKSVQKSTRQAGESFLRIYLRRRIGRVVGAILAGAFAHEWVDLLAFLIQQKIPLTRWSTAAGCLSPGMALVAEAAHLARQDHLPRWWDLPLENLQQFWQQWKERSSGPS